MKDLSEEFDKLEPREPKAQRSPGREKQLDYKHQRRSTEGGQGWRKTRSRLPHIERRRYRQAQESALRIAMSNEDMELSAGDSVKAIRRSNFVELHSRREIPLAMEVKLRVRQIWLRSGRKKGRHILPPKHILAELFQSDAEEEK